MFGQLSGTEGAGKRGSVQRNPAPGGNPTPVLARLVSGLARARAVRLAAESYSLGGKTR